MSQFFNELRGVFAGILSDIHDDCAGFSERLGQEFAGTPERRLQTFGAICGIVGGIMELGGSYDYFINSRYDSDPTRTHVDISLIAVGVSLMLVGLVAFCKTRCMQVAEDQKAQPIDITLTDTDTVIDVDAGSGYLSLD